MSHAPALPLFVLVVAGGSGVRMGGPVPKQFLPLCGRPVLMHTLEAFFRWKPDLNLVLVLPKEEIETWGRLCHAHDFYLPHRVVPGGTTRHQSVRNGLSALPAHGLVAIHDGVRPLVSREVMETCFREAAIHGSAVPVTEMIDSVRIITPLGSSVLDRAQLRCVQTPQTFNLSQLHQAFERAETDTFTDDAAVFEAAGFPIHLCSGDPRNIKITTTADLMVAEAWLQAKS